MEDFECYEDYFTTMFSSLPNQRKQIVSAQLFTIKHFEVKYLGSYQPFPPRKSRYLIRKALLS